MDTDLAFDEILLCRQELMESKRQRQVKKVELGKRRSAASQNRMRIISSLGAEVTAKKGKQNSEDTFGMDDDDWNIYRAIVSHCLSMSMSMYVVMNPSPFPCRINTLRIVTVREKKWSWERSLNS